MSDSYTSDADGFPDRGPSVFAVTTGTLTLCSVFVAARVYCRSFIVRRLSWDDYFIVLAWFLAFGLSFTINYGTRKGLGRHDADILDGDRGALRRCEYVFSILYNPALMAAKTSILIFYLRLSKNTQKVLRMASWAVLVVVNIAGTVLTLLNIFQCRPVEAAFNQAERDQGAKCIPLLTEFICSAPVNIVTDLAILALPIPVLTSMRLPSKQKTILVITFALGIFVTVVDVIRIYYLQQAITNVPTAASSDPNSIFGDSSEFSWNASLSLMWSAVEVNVGITCACIPTLKPLIIKILPAMITDPDGTRTETFDVDKMAKHASMQSANRTAARRTPSPVATNSRTSGDPDDVNVLEFLTTPDMLNDGAGPASPTRQPRLHQRWTASSLATLRNGRQENSVYFGFVNMQRPKSMLRTSASESFKYCTVVTILFFLWGFSYGLLNTLNNVVAAVAHMSTVQTLGLTSAYFGGGYLFGPLLVGEWILRHDEHRRRRRRRDGQGRCGGDGGGREDAIGGFKATFIVGLCVYGTGTIMFWPSAVLASFPGFLISNFVVGFGLAILETAANPFIALCGPDEYAEMRLLLAQGVQGVGSVLSGLLAQNVYFVNIASSGYTDSMTLLDVQWTYLAITLFCVALALFFYYMPLPEVSDAALERAAARLPVDTTKPSVGGLQLRTVSLVVAALANWTYVAAQESMSIYAHSLLTIWLPSSASPLAQMGGSDNAAAPPPAAMMARDPQGAAPGETSGRPAGLSLSVPNYLLVAHTAFTVSRFACGYVAYLSVRHPRHRLVPTPRTMLTTSAALAAIFALLIVILKPKRNPNLIAVPVMLYHLAEGPLWPLIFATGLRGQGRRTKRAAAWLTVGGSGPAFWPYVMYAIVRAGGSVQMAFILVVCFFLVTLAYPLYLTFVKDARAVVEPATHGGLAPADPAGERGTGGGRRRGGPSHLQHHHRPQDTLAEADETDEAAAHKREEAGDAGGGGLAARLSRSFGARRKRPGRDAADAADTTTSSTTGRSSSPAAVEQVEDSAGGGSRHDEGGQVPDIPEER